MTSNELRLTVALLIAVVCMFLGQGLGYVLTAYIDHGDADMDFGVRLALASSCGLLGFVRALSLKVYTVKA